MQFDEIYIKYFKDVYLYLLKLSGNESVAEDITSETFFKAMKNIDGVSKRIVFNANTSKREPGRYGCSAGHSQGILELAGKCGLSGAGQKCKQG